MGRIKTTYIKRKTRDIMKVHGEKFTTDFTLNKEKLVSTAVIKSKKIRNVIAGYVSRLKKREQ